jgi:hypothetical protein
MGVPHAAPMSIPVWNIIRPMTGWNRGPKPDVMGPCRGHLSSVEADTVLTG